MVDVRQYIEERYPDEAVLIMDGMDEAFLGVGYAFSTPLAVYDREKIIQVLMDMGMDREGAEEYFSFNIQGAYVGERTPVILERMED